LPLVTWPRESQSKTHWEPSDSILRVLWLAELYRYEKLTAENAEGADEIDVSRLSWLYILVVVMLNAAVSEVNRAEIYVKGNLFTSVNSLFTFGPRRVRPVSLRTYTLDSQWPASDTLSQ
jgi:hypothetical protein